MASTISSSPSAIAIPRCSAKTAEAFHKKHKRKLDQIGDYRRLLDRKDIDAISIATPNHTHSLIAIAAVQAGKDVYVEKPVSQKVWEGRQLVNASDKYKQIVQCGTQSRSHESIRQAVDYVHSGKLGKNRVHCRHVLQAADVDRQER